MKSGKSELLSVSPFPSVKAVLRTLEYTLTPKENTIEISFEFVSSASPKALESEIPHSVKITENETLWDIAYRYDIPVERLLQLNPAVKRPDILENGWVITLW
nr:MULTISPECIES: LysM domain-containing protein [unclassified Ruminococcus]